MQTRRLCPALPHAQDGKHLPLWHKAFTGPAHTKADLAERLHELEAHVSRALCCTVPTPGATLPALPNESSTPCMGPSRLVWHPPLVHLATTSPAFCMRPCLLLQTALGLAAQEAVAAAAEAIKAL